MNEFSPIIRFKKFNNNWKEKKWIETVDISTDMVDPKTGDYDELQHIGPGNIESFTGRILGNVKSVKEEDLISGKFKFQPGDIIYGKINPQLAKYALPNFEGLTSADTYVLNTKNEVTQEFLYRILQTRDFYKYSVSVSKRTGMPKINRKELNQYSYFTPSLEEQNKIGDFFKQLDEGIDLNQHALSLIKQRKKAFLQKMFPKKGESVPELRFSGLNDEWKKQKLGDLVDISTGKLDANAMKENGKYDFYTSGIKKYKIDIPAFEGPAITIAGNGATVGYMHYADGKFNAYQRTYVLTNFKAVREYIYLEIERKLPRKIKEEARTGNIPYIIMGMLTDLEVQIPSIEEQKVIGNFFKELDNSITLQEEKIEALRQMKKAFLQKMFV